MEFVSHPHESRIADLLSDYADGVAPLETLLDRYNVSYQQVSELVDLADQLRSTLVEVSPSPQFVDGLLQELIGEQQAAALGWWSRIQAMPTRTKLAAGIGGITLTAGVLLITARSLSHLLGLTEREEAPGKAIA